MTLRYTPTSFIYELETSHEMRREMRREMWTRFAREGRLHMPKRKVFLICGIDEPRKNDFSIRNRLSELR